MAFFLRNVLTTGAWQIERIRLLSRYLQNLQITFKSIKIGHTFRLLPTKRHYTRLIRKKPASSMIHTPQARHTMLLGEVRFRHLRTIPLVVGEHLQLGKSGGAPYTTKMSGTQINCKHNTIKLKISTELSLFDNQASIKRPYNE